MQKRHGWEYRHETEYDGVDRVRFYFSIADGWTDGISSRQRDYEYGGYDEQGKWIILRESEFRRKVAHKAFEMLCSKVFPMPLEVDGDRFMEINSKWYHSIANERLFPVIQNFWRLKVRYFGDIEIPNLRRSYGDRDSHHEKKSFEFLINLAEFMWKWRGRPQSNLSWDKDKKAAETAEDEKTLQRIDAAKPWMIEVLNVLGHLDVLDKYTLVLEEQCIAKLHEIALRKEMPYRFNGPIDRSDRKAKSLEEACYAGSKAAWLIKRIENVRAVDKKLKAAEDAKRRLEAAKENARKLGVEA